MAVGAISYYLDQFVVGRIVRSTYGIPCSTKFDTLDPEHRKRAHKKFLGVTGEFKLGIYFPTLFKVAFLLSNCTLGTEPTFRVRGYRVRRSFAMNSLASAQTLPSPAKLWSSLSSVIRAQRRTRGGWMRSKVGVPTYCPCGTIASEKQPQRSSKRYLMFPWISQRSRIASDCPSLVSRSTFTDSRSSSYSVKLSSKLSWLGWRGYVFYEPTVGLIPLTNLSTGNREAVCLPGRDGLYVLTSLQQRRCCPVR